VLCIDGLEARLVERWGLKGFMQREWGVHDVLVVSGSTDRLYTPLVWGAFLLGEDPSKYGFGFDRIREERLRAAYGVFYPLYRLRVALFGKRKLGLKRIAERLGIFSVERVKKRIGAIERLPEEALGRTFIAEAERLGFKVWVREFPSLNDIKVAELRAEVHTYFSKGFSERVRVVEEVYRFSVGLLDEALRAAKDCDLVLYYTPVIDYANHMFYRPGKLKCMVKLASYYRRVCRLVERVSGKFSDSAVLVVSDHGYDPRVHEHSGYGFWSSNVVLDEKPRTILDFRDVILGLLKR